MMSSIPRVPSTDSLKKRPSSELPDAALSPAALEGAQPQAAILSEASPAADHLFGRHGWWRRNRYSGALAFNFAAFLLPAAYATLSKLWIASIDSSLVSTTDSYTYMSTVTEVLNEGLPRAAWSTIGNFSSHSLPSRISFTLTLIAVQSLFGLILSVIFLAAAPAFAATFVPGAVRAASIKYVRISAFGSLASTVEVAVSLGTRALDKPDVPLLISTVKTAVQIILELVLISTVHVPAINPTIQTQATIRLVTDMLGATVGLIYFLWIVKRFRLPNFPRLSLASLRVLLGPGKWTFSESAVRNAIYLYLIHSIVAMGQNYATAWGVFNTIRWGLIMVPVSAFEATSNTFVGHRWGIFLAGPRGKRGQKASGRDLWFITAPAIVSAIIVSLVEAVLCLTLSLWAVRPFARYLSGSEEVAVITERMWRTIDWCYIFYAISTCLATILLATQTKWYFLQSLLSNLIYSLPWAITISRINVTPDTAWTYDAFIFGGALVVSMIVITGFDVVWAWRVRSGKLR